MEYLRLANKILQNGNSRSDRTKTGTLSLFGEQMRFDLKNHKIPILTTKYIPWKSCLKELLWFLKGQTDTKILEQQNVFIWKKNSSIEFLRSRNLEYEEGDIGPGYGFQWRYFGSQYKDCHTNYTNGVDQIQYIINLLKTDPNSRRIFLTSWNPLDINKMALPPCHLSCQFYVSEDKYLSCHMYQRSMDLFLGAPWNILSYSILTCILAKYTNLEPFELIISIGDCHIYNNHIQLLKLQSERLSYCAPQLYIKENVIEKSINELNTDDFEIQNYDSNEKIYGEMSV